MGLCFVDLVIPQYSWDQNGTHEKDVEQKENSAVWTSSKGSCTEAPGGAAGQSPVELKAGETPQIGGAPATY